MAYQQVGTPRFYVDSISWLASLGVNVAPDNDLYSFEYLGLNPSKQFEYDIPAQPATTAAYLLNQTHLPKVPLNFCAILGHNYAGQRIKIGMHIGSELQTYDTVWFQGSGSETSVNSGTYSNGDADFIPEYNGFTIITFNEVLDKDIQKLHIYQPDDTGTNTGAWNSKTGSFCFGKYFDMPHSPDLSLTLSYDYSGIKHTTTLGGSSLSNNFYSKPPKWGDKLGAWELHNPDDGDPPNQDLSRSGRKVWDLSFSYLDDGDVFGANQLLSFTPGVDLNDDNYDGSIPSGDLKSTTEFQYNLLTDNNFYSQVIHKTNGGQLPFLFQPNKDDPTNIVIARFDMSTFACKQVANGVYNIKVKIRESW